MVEKRRINIFGNGIKISIQHDSFESSSNERPDSNIGGKFIYIPEKNGYEFVEDKKS